MNESGYSFAMDDWAWSYSRLKSYEQCPYGFFVSYYEHVADKVGNFYSDYGTFVHTIHQKYYQGKIRDPVSYYISHFSENVVNAPDESIKSSYFLSGLEYFKRGIRVPPLILGVEKKIRFDVGGYSFTGFVDLLEQDGCDVTITDHKSHNLLPRSERKKKSNDELDEYQKQLYLYGYGLKRCGLRSIKYINFNCFRSGLEIKEPYDNGKERDSVSWALRTIHSIRCAETFNPTPDWFFCNNLCNVRNYCEYRRAL